MHAGRDLSRVRRLGFANVVEHLLEALPLKRELPGQHLVEEDADREQVRGRRERRTRAFGLLRGHVSRRADDELVALNDGRVHVTELLEELVQVSEGFPEAIFVVDGGGPPIHQDDLVIGQNDHVLRLEIEVDDAALVSMPQSLAELLHDLERALERKRRDPRGVPVHPKHLCEASPGDLAHRVRRQPLRSQARVEDRNDARLVEAAEDTRLVHESTKGVRLLRELPPQGLAGHDPAEVRVVDPIHPAERALAEAAEQAVPRIASQSVEDLIVFVAPLGHAAALPPRPAGRGVRTRIVASTRSTATRSRSPSRSAPTRHRRTAEAAPRSPEPARAPSQR